MIEVNDGYSEMYPMKATLMVVLIALFLAGCAAPGIEPALSEMTQAPEAGALASVTTGAEENSMSVTENSPEAAGTADSASQSGPIVSQSGPPSVVDLQSLTPIPPDPNQTPRVMPAPGVPGGPAKVAGLEPLLNKISADLSRRQNIPLEQISVKTVQVVTWPDGSLGCPQPGMMYTMSLVDGYQIILVANGQTFFYHTAGRDQFIYCANAKPVKGVE